jgi:hypothetical protein
MLAPMADQPTCGRGIAANASLAAKLAELTAAVASNLEAHMPTLDRADPAAAREHEVYGELAAEHRDLAARLTATAEHMAAQRELPMGRHDEAALAGPEVRAAFERLVRVQDELADLLRERLELHRAMLAAAAATAAQQQPG